jgi:hypothetical protein
MADSLSRHSSRYESESHYRYKRAGDEVKKRPLPDLSMENDPLNLRIVYPKTLYVVGVEQKLNDAEVFFRSFRR